MPRNGFVLRGAVITAALALVASLCACCAAPKAASLPPTTLSSATGGARKGLPFGPFKLRGALHIYQNRMSSLERSREQWRANAHGS